MDTKQTDEMMFLSALALSLADRAYVLESGDMTLSGPAAELLGNPQVQAAYLGA